MPTWEQRALQLLARMESTTDDGPDRGMTSHLEQMGRSEGNASEISELRKLIRMLPEDARMIWVR